MSLLAKEQAISHGQRPSMYAPIVQALTGPSDSEEARLKHKFDSMNHGSGSLNRDDEGVGVVHQIILPKNQP